ncbi:hypothetical protein ACIRLA_28965 [Streptomyces sp. NPDC102364]|uniref:hypothetical protein n=1 Tax=Streptomyces sp. NPDC102364 TaxID=3366161 RepID=UPI00380D4B13
MKRAAIILGAATAALLLSGCSAATEEWNDAPVQYKDDGPARIHSMPDGFANWADKCDGFGHRVFTTREGVNGGGKSVAVINDSKCFKNGEK